MIVQLDLKNKLQYLGLRKYIPTKYNKCAQPSSPRHLHPTEYPAIKIPPALK